MNDEELEKIRQEHAAFAETPFEVESHTHLEQGCRCLSCLVFLGAQISAGMTCEELPDAEKAYGKGCDEWVLTSDQARYLLDSRDRVGVLLTKVDELRAQVARYQEMALDEMVRLGQEFEAPYPADTHFWVEWRSNPGFWIRYSNYKFPDPEGAHEANRLERERIPSFHYRVVQATTTYGAEETK